jgi:hypothetical protein
MPAWLKLPSLNDGEKELLEKMLTGFFTGGGSAKDDAVQRS